MTLLARVRCSIGAGLLAGGLAAMPTLGGTTASQATKSIVNSATRPAPVTPPITGATGGFQWVPDRWIPVPGQPNPAFVPGHWEQKIDERRSYAPPLVVIDPATGAVRNTPAEIKETPPAERIGP